MILPILRHPLILASFALWAALIGLGDWLDSVTTSGEPFPVGPFMLLALMSGPTIFSVAVSYVILKTGTLKLVRLRRGGRP